ncbi:MAG: nucleotidyl transferase AbiEii/AbiGii toxin family protein, partial [Gammaproteobacteria bacterium]|nr:nucleotidyl transferase AbiEii/AbiGii toxin family protein [Gammaproteobacteria bacterium]
MDRASTYYKQVQLLVQLLPLIAEESCFALKGGTAINLFVRDLPRLSVDIDLVYLPMNNRQEALDDITRALARIAQRIKKVFSDVEIVESYKSKPDALRLVVSRKDIKIKIELSPVLRGTVFKPEVRNVCQKVEDEFGYAEIAVVALPDLYAGKICAALDRQHPRDLFDVKILLDSSGLTDITRRALLVYLISHPRPIAELLSPARKDMKQLYEGEFLQIEEQHVSLEELERTRENMIQSVNAGLTENEKKFLLTFKKKAPDWSLLNLEGIENLPAVNWKLINLNNMKSDKHEVAYKKL